MRGKIIRFFWASRLRRLATIFVVFVFVATIVIANFPQKVEAIATLGTSSSSTPNANISQRTVVESTNGTTLVVYQSGTETPAGLAYRTSTDDAATWSSGTQIDTTTSTDFSIVIDGNDNVYVVWADSGTTKIRKLTYSGGSWSVGSSNTIKSAVTCNASTTGYSHSRPVIAISSDSTVWVSLIRYRTVSGSCTGSYYEAFTTRSISLTAWTDNIYVLSSDTVTFYISMLAIGKSLWVVTPGGIYVDNSGSGVFVLVNSTPFVTNPVSLAYGLNEGLLFYKNVSNNLVFRKFTITDQVLSSETIISSAANDVPGVISTDSYNHWVTYQSYVGASSYNTVYKKYDGSSWDVSSTAITTDNANNAQINAPARIPNTISVPVVWNTGTGSPYTIKSHSISTMGSATDSGNTGASYSGSLTGSNGDQIVKSGEWWYSSINIVSGMTVRVLASDGVTGGTLILHGSSVTVAGSVNGSARGLPGAIGLYGTGGYGGSGGVGGGGGGNEGLAGYSYPGSVGVGSYGGTNGSAGTNASGYVGGGGLSSAAGTGGIGTSVTAGTNGSLGGYLSSGINGDTSTNDSAVMGSGGGSGGSGGSGTGGGGGAGGADNGGVGGSGGYGGAGAPGGYGGKGGNGGALVKIYSTSSATISGSVTATGETGTSGGAGGTGSNGIDGTGGCDLAC